MSNTPSSPASNDLLTTWVKRGWHWLVVNGWRVWLTLILLAFVFILLHVHLIVNILAALVLVAGIYFLLPERGREQLKSGREWFTDHFFALSAGVLLIFSLVFLSFWLLVNLFWTSTNALQKTTVLYDSRHGHTLHVRHPVLILADRSPVPVTFILKDASLVTPTLEPTTSPMPTSTSEPTATPLPTLGIIVALPSGVAVADSPYETEHSLNFQLHLGTPTYTQTLLLVNDRTTAHGLQVDKELAVTLPATTNKPVSNIIPVVVEGEWGYTLRTFINSAVNEKSPLIILAAGLISGAGFMYREYLNLEKERRKQEKQKQEEEAKKRKREERYRELQVEANEKLARFRELLVAGDEAGLEKIFNELKETREALNQLDNEAI